MDELKERPKEFTKVLSEWIYKTIFDPIKIPVELDATKADNRLVYSAFRARYGIDLIRERLHGFAFLAMLVDLSGCSLSNIISIRGIDLAKLGDNQRQYAVMQERYRTKPQISDADKAIMAEFEEQLKG